MSRLQPIDLDGTEDLEEVNVTYAPLEEVSATAAEEALGEKGWSRGKHI